MNHRRRAGIIGILAFLAVASVVGARSAQDQGAGESALSIARAYLAGMEAGQLDALDPLFLADGRSSILENASDEGSWEHYRDHHLKPEMKTSSEFRFTVTSETEQRFGPTTLVRQVGTFTIQVGEQQRLYRAAISYLVVEDAGRLKIAHLHWSSRAKRQ